MRRRPERMRLLIVPSGSFSITATRTVGVASEISQLDGFALDARQLGDSLAHSLGGGQVEHFLLQIVASLGHGPGTLLPWPPAHLGAQDVNGAPVGHGEQEGAQGAACRVVALRLTP